MVTLRLAEKDDFDFFYKLKSEASNIFWTGHDSPPDRDGLQKYFDNILAYQDEKLARKIYVILYNNSPVGTIYLIPSGSSEEFEIAPAVAEEHWGKGIARQAISLSLSLGKELGLRKMVTTIREDNISSLRAFQACGVHITDLYHMVYIPGLKKEVKMFVVEKEL